MQIADRNHEKRAALKIKTAAGLLYGFMRKIKYDHVSSFAAHAALFILMSLFPMAMFCISMFQYLPLDAGVLTSYILMVMPGGLKPLLEHILAEAYTGSATIMLKSFTMLVMLFCASKGVYAVIIGMNAIYGIRETRGTVLLYILAIVYVLVFFSVIGLVMVLIVLGNNLFHGLVHFIPGLAMFDAVFRYVKNICMPLILVCFFMLIYMNVPNRKSRLRYELPGAVFSTVAWLAFSWAFSFYISNFAQYSVTYGSLATIVIFILWLYDTMIIVFIGAEINMVLRKYAEYGYNLKYVYEYYKDKYENQ